MRFGIVGIASILVSAVGGLAAKAQHASPAPAIGPVIGAVNAADTPIEGSFEGLFVEGFETSRFMPCLSGASWWLNTTGEANGPFWLGIENLRNETNTALGADKSAGAPLYYLRIDGRASETGQFGHLGAYTREVTVKSVATMRIATPVDLRRCDSAYTHLQTADMPRLDAAKN